MLAVLKKLKYSSAESYTHEEVKEDLQLLVSSWAWPYEL